MSVERADRLAKLVAEEGLERLLVTNLVNVRYLTGFTGHQRRLRLRPRDRAFLTDFRYIERAASEIGGWELSRSSAEWIDRPGRAPLGALRLRGPAPQRAGLARADRAGAGGRRACAGRRADREAAAGQGRQRARGDRRGREAHRRGLQVDARAGPRGQDARTRSPAPPRRGSASSAPSPSFPPIVAAGPNGAMPHAEPGEREIGSGEMVIFDMGAQLDGYCSDCTRTFAVGKPSGEAARGLRAGAAGPGVGAEGGRRRARPGQGRGRRRARSIIEAANHGDHFGHGLGHGVGLEVHEAPRLSQRSDEVLESGEVVTVEPGVYVPAKLGVRIEDLVVVDRRRPREPQQPRRRSCA